MIKGIHHIGVNVPNLDEAAAFYQGATGWALAEANNEDEGPTVGDQCNRSMRLNGHTAHLQLTQAPSQMAEPQAPVPVYGPGITHICIQSPVAAPAFDAFRAQGAIMHSRGGRPVRLARPDITYVYLRDPADNMFEVEQWDEPPQPHAAWIAHVAFVSPDIERLTNFYSTVLLGQDAPPEIRRVKGIPNLDVVANADNLDIYGTWISTGTILLEIWQYINPPTPNRPIEGSLENPGYTHVCFEVEGMAHEFQRLTGEGVQFLSEPVKTESYTSVFGHDPDGNLFELREYL